MQRLGIFLLSIIGLALLWAGTLHFRKNIIEEDLTARSTERLKAAGFETLQLSFVGRDATLTGRSPGTEGEQKAIQAVQNTNGVRVVNSAFTVPSPEDIAADLKRKSDAALAASGFAGLTTRFTGADGVVQGMWPGSPKDTNAVALVRGIPGVNTVTHDYTQPKPTKAEIAADLEAKARAKLASAGFTGITVKCDGTDCLLSGVSQGASTDDVAIAVVQGIRGVGAVNGNFTVPEVDVSAEIAEKVRGKLAATYLTTVDVTAAGTVVTLSGRSPGALKEQQAIELAHSVQNVTSVIAKFTNADGILITDAMRENALQCAQAVQGELATGAINFKTGSSTLAESSKPMLQRLAAQLKKCPTATVDIEGHTDNTGNADSNRALSERRAEAVGQFLITNGVDQTKIRVSGYGESRPIAANNTAEGRAQNRRIEFSIVL